MQAKSLFILLVSIILGNALMAQEQLPDFSVYKVSGRVVLSWTHNYPVVKQISIQRSHDSKNFFKTIATMPDPSLQENGFADRQAPYDSMYYRIYILLDQGHYIVTKAKKPVADTSGAADVYEEKLPETNNKVVLPSGFMPSQYVFTAIDNYVKVELPNDQRKYSIKFYSENYQPLFELDNIKERKFKLDRTYFFTSGYINFELYADGKLIEKHKFYLPKS
ncbi:MAG TPA: hypothetical protein PK110_09505 [Niabella sp.]|nr:hypothetical protein [Niabella sp.]